jgi:phage shock protein A
MTLTRIVRGVLEVESFYQTTTTWDVRGPARPDKYKVLIRQPQTGANYQLAERPPGTEDLEGAWLIPIELAANERSATLKVVEQTPSKISLAIWDQQALALLEKFLTADNLDAAARKQLQPVVDLRREIGRIDTEVDGLRRQQYELESRADQTRRNLEAIKKDPAAGGLRQKLNKRLDEFSADADSLGRKIVELESKRLERKIELEDMIQDLDLRAPSTPGKPGAAAAGATSPGKGQ